MLVFANQKDVQRVWWYLKCIGLQRLSGKRLK